MWCLFLPPVSNFVTELIPANLDSVLNIRGAVCRALYVTTYDVT